MRTSGRTACAALILLAFATQAIRAGELPAAGAEQHLWYTVSRAASVELVHYASVDHPHARTLMTLPRRPDGIAAWGRDVFLVFETPAVRDVFRLSVVHDAASGLYFSDPPDRLEAIASLPRDGRLAGFAAGSGGPVALIDDGVLKLYRLQGPAWIAETMETIRMPSAMTAVAARGESARIVIASADAGLAWRETDDGWEASPLRPIEGLRRLVRVGPRVIAVAIDGDSVVLWHLRARGRPLRLATLAQPSAAWALTGLEDGPRLLIASEAGLGSMVRVDPITGGLGAVEPLSPSRLSTLNLLRLPALLAIGIFVFIFVVILRPAATDSLPKDLAPLALGRRAAGLAIDLALGGGLAIVAFRIPAATLFSFPLAAPDPADALGQLVAAGLAAAHMTAGEVIFRTTLGKRLVRGRVVAADGSRPRVLPLLVRNLVKTLVLLLPPLVVVVLTNPYRQGLHDLAARTIVVGNPPGGGDAQD